MNYRTLGRTNLKVSEIGLGTFPLGGIMISPGPTFTPMEGFNRKEGVKIVRRALDLGINFIDTAPIYGLGESERIVGEALRGREEEVIIAAKVGYYKDGPIQHPYKYKSFDFIVKAFEEILKRLRRDTVDILQIHDVEHGHWWDGEWGKGVVVDVLNEIRKEGRTRFIGITGNYADRLATVLGNNPGVFDTVQVAHRYDLIWRDAEKRLLPLAKQNNLGIIIATPFREGLFVRQDENLVKTRYWGRVEQFKLLYALQERLEIPLTELCLRFVLSNPDVGVVLQGPQKIEELEQNVSCAGKTLPIEVLQELDKISKMDLHPLY